MKHSIWYLPITGEERCLRQRTFRKAFSPSAHRWFRQTICQHNAAQPVPIFANRVDDKTLAGYHYSVNGNVYELR